MKFFVLLAVLFACKPKGWDARCRESLNDLCSLRVACGFDASFADCQTYLDENWTCDTNVIEQAFDPCIVKLETYLDANPPVCTEAIPAECSDILCNTQYGCDFVTATGLKETGNFPFHTGGGTTGGTGGTSGSGGGGL